MSRLSKRSLSRSAIAAYLCICAALLLLLGLTMWGTYRDVQFLRVTLLEGEIDRLRSHAERTVGRIERDLETRSTTELEVFRKYEWLHRRWQCVIPQEEPRLYAAVVNADGSVLLHSDPERVHQRLSRDWYNRILSEVGEDVFETRDSVLTRGDRAYDVRVPIKLDAREVGEYHVGFDVDWFENRIAQKEASFLRRRSVLVGGVLLVVLLATTSLYYIATHSIALRRAADMAALERATEVGKLAAGLAHEIRNPLHAIRLNLHSFRRACDQQLQLSEDEVTTMLEQSAREIDRIEQLMQQLVRFAAPEEPRNEVIDLASEIQNVVDFIEQELLDKNVEIETHLPNGPVRAYMDRGRLRQIMLNLLQNAQQSMEDGGQIDVELVRRRGKAEITVIDNGPGISEMDRQRIFEPFFSTKPDGTGLGLALVKRFIDDVDGAIHCERSPAGGVTFRISLREAAAPRTA